MKYSRERVETICKYLREGETQERAAKLAGITKETFHQWLRNRTDFADEVKKAKADYENWQLNGILDDARKSLKILVCGTDYEEVKTEYVNDANGNPTIRKQTRVTKKIMPNAGAVIFALCNRDPEHWQNRVANDITGHLETESKGGGISLSNVPDELLAQVIDAIKGE